MSGIASLVLTLIATYSTFFAGDKGIARAKVYLWIASGLCFVFANYEGWAKERRKYEAEKAKHDNPNLELAVVSILTQYVSKTNVTMACFAGVVINRGSPSIAFGWKLRYQSQTVDVTIPYVTPFPDEYEWPPIEGKVLILEKKTLLPARTLTPIERGHSPHGRVVFELPGDRRDEIYSGAAQMWVGCTDTTGRLCQALFKTGPASIQATLQLFPDERVRDATKQLSNKATQR